MNPFDLRGPPFLVFYVVVGVIGLVYLYLDVRGLVSGRGKSPSADARRVLSDPYLLAFLRGGAREALQTVTFSLHQRGLLVSLGRSLLAVADRQMTRQAAHPLEQAVLATCVTAKKASAVLADRGLAHAIADFAQPLRDAGLIADLDETSHRWKRLLAVVGSLLAISAIKVAVALDRGHSNVALLIILSIIVLIIAVAIVLRRRTYAGDLALADMQTLFTPLKQRASRLTTRDATDEAVLFAAVFGLAALPATAYPFAATLRQREAAGGDGGGGSSGCGSGGGGGCGGCGGGG